jgi:undecaprenyl-diphosphatase
MIESIILGVVQGVFEWLPVSSEGLLVLIQTQFFDGATLTEAIRIALFLHLGTFLAAFIYFFDEVEHLIRGLFNYKKISAGRRAVLNFYIIATLISGVVGLILKGVLVELEQVFTVSADIIVIVVAVLLFVTAYLQLRKKTMTFREETEVNNADAVVAGVVQGLSALPGVSRSGSTTSILLIQRFHEVDALKLSFVLSLPIVLAGNIVFNLNSFFLSVESLVAFLVSFIFGWITIDALLKLARKMNFGWFVLIFAVLLIASLFI